MSGEEEAGDLRHLERGCIVYRSIIDEVEVPISALLEGEENGEDRSHSGDEAR